MKIIEKLIVLFAFVSLILKLNVIEGGGLLITTSLSILALLYLPFGLLLFGRMPSEGNLRNRLSIAIGIGLAMICSGIIFKLQLLPYPEINLTTGLLTIILATIIASNKFQINTDKHFLPILKRIIIVGIAAIVFLLTPYSVIEKFRFRNHPKYLEVYQEHLNNPEDKDLKIKLRLEYDRAVFSEEKFIELHPEEKTES
jgi:hypothetical protein